MSQILNNLRREAFRSGSMIEKLMTYELPRYSIVPNRTKYYHNRHRDPKYRKERTRKVWMIDLPDFDKMRKEEAGQMDPELMRTRLKEKGVAPPNPWNEREMYSPSTTTVIDPYQPPDDEKSSSLLDKVKSPLAAGKELIKKRRETSAIKSFEGDDFDLDAFANQATEIYVKAHESLAAREESNMFEYVTEHCFPAMTAGLKRHTVVWKYLGDVEPPSVVQVRSGDVLSKGNKYSQITVRLHTKQILAIYDRHGRLIYGSPNDVKEVLDYVVFEKYLANEYGHWRMHDRNKQS